MNGKKSNVVAHIGYVPTDIRDGSLSWIRDRRLSSALRQCVPASRAQLPCSVPRLPGSGKSYVRWRLLQATDFREKGSNIGWQM
ncbi:hypothetical protein J2Z84_001287 [Agrobacterium rubi]|nr:hypothetical protein [Agrobacterium rubi]